MSETKKYWHRKKGEMSPKLLGLPPSNFSPFRPRNDLIEKTDCRYLM